MGEGCDDLALDWNAVLVDLSVERVAERNHVVDIF